MKYCLAYKMYEFSRKIRWYWEKWYKKKYLNNINLEQKYIIFDWKRDKKYQ